VETFHIVSECKTAIYFSRCLVQGLLNNTAVLTIGTNTASLLTTAARLRLTTNNRDRTRQQDIQAEDATILHKEQIRPKIDLIHSTI
jgi:hypothetical protein